MDIIFLCILVLAVIMFIYELGAAFARRDVVAVAIFAIFFGVFIGETWRPLSTLACVDDPSSQACQSVASTNDGLPMRR